MVVGAVHGDDMQGAGPGGGGARGNRQRQAVPAGCSSSNGGDRSGGQGGDGSRQPGPAAALAIKTADGLGWRPICTQGGMRQVLVTRVAAGFFFFFF